MTWVFATIVVGFLIPLFQLWVFSWFTSGSYTSFMILSFILLIAEIIMGPVFLKIVGFICMVILLISLHQFFTGAENIFSGELFGFSIFAE